MEPDILLEVDRIRAGYNGMTVLKGISLQIRRRHSAAILGPNGSGKSTLMKVLFGLPEVRVNAGRVLYEADDITRLSPRSRLARSVLYLPQGLDVFPSLTVEENLQLFGEETPWMGRISFLEEAYRHLPLLEKKKRVRAGNLSGGERRLVALSRAIAAKPTLALLDEPSAGLSPSAVADMAHFISCLETEGTTVVLVEQNVGIASGLAKQCFVLRDGVVTLDFPTSEFEQRKSEVTRQFIPSHKEAVRAGKEGV